MPVTSLRLPRHWWFWQVHTFEVASCAASVQPDSDDSEPDGRRLSKIKLTRSRPGRRLDLRPRRHRLSLAARAWPRPAVPVTGRPPRWWLQLTQPGRELGNFRIGIGWFFEFFATVPARRPGRRLSILTMRCRLPQWIRLAGPEIPSHWRTRNVITY